MKNKNYKLFGWCKIIFLCFVFIPTSTYSQTYKAYLKAGDKAMNDNKHYEAYTYFKTAMKIDSSDAILWYKIAQAAHNFNLFREANYYYQKIAKKQGSTTFADYHKKIPKQQNTPTFANFYIHWAATKKVLGQYKKAAELYQKHPNKTWKNYPLADLIKACKEADHLKKQPSKAKVRHLEKPVNTPYSDFGAQQVGDELIYSSLRFKGENQQRQETYFSKLVYSKNGKKGRTMPKKFNEENSHTANSFFTNNGNTVYFTRCNRVEGKAQMQCVIYSREKINGRWKKAKKLPKAINKEGFTATHPTVGFDSIKQVPTLFFATDRGSKNEQLTLWRSEIRPNGKYSRPKKIAIEQKKNAAYITPYFHTPTQTLYFSTNTINTLGGYDIFKTKRSKNGWQPIKNMGYPINSGYNDIYFRLNSDDTTGYISSNREDALYLTRGSCCYDIYAVTLQPQKPKLPKKTIVPKPKTTPPILVSKTKVPSDSLPPLNSINVPLKPTQPSYPQQPTSMTELKKLLPIALYFHNDRPNPRTRRTTTNLNYTTTYDTYFAMRSTYHREYSKGLTGTAKIDAEQAINNFFFNKVQRGFQKLEVVSGFLLLRLQSGKSVEIIIKGYTSPRATSDYNLKLAKRRISSLRNYFSTYQNGIFRTYIRNGQLKITEAAFGETTASSAISDQLDDRRNSIYSVEASQERRVEILDVR